MDLRQTDVAVRDVKWDSGFEGFRGFQEKGLRDSGVKDKTVVKFRFKIHALAICAALMTFATTSWGQLFTQDFSSSSTVSSYVNSSSPNNGQFNAIGTSGSGVVITINSGKLRFARATANAGAFSRTTDFSGPPTSLIYKFDIQMSGNSSATTSVAVLQVGSGFGTANSAESNANTHSRVGINTTSTAGTFSFRDLGGSANSSNLSGSQSITWVINNSGSTLTYLAPDGTYESVANDTWDLWAGTTRLFNDIAAQTTTQTLADIKFAITTGTATIDFDNIVIDPIPSAPSAAPTFSSVGSSGFTVNWNAATGATGYRLDIDDNSDFSSPVSGYNNLAVAGTSQAVTGLNASTTYYARVRTENYAGTSNHSSSGTQATTSAATVPAAPTITGITPGNGELSVAFTAGSDGGSGITNYKYSINGGSSFTAVSPGATTSPITITGLNNGTPYNVQIRAVNAVGDGTATASTAATPRTTPGAPTDLSVTPGNGQLTASFTAPASNGGSAITNYEYSTNGGSSFTAVSPASTSTSIVITSLLNGTSYNVQVRAVNAAGKGTPTSSVAGTPATPTSPTISTTGTFSALSTFVGTASSSSSISVSSTALTADITATRPSTQFEVSSDNSIWGATATFAQSGGVVSGTLYVRLTSGALVGTPSGNVTLSSTGASSVTAAVSGTVNKVDPTAHVTNFATGTIDASNIPLTWTAATGSPDGYLIRVSSTTVSDPVDGTPVADDTSLSDGVAAFNVTSGATTSYSGFTGFVAGTTYTFKIYPYNNSGASIRFLTDATVPSASGLLPPAATGTPTFASVTATGFTVNWSAVTGADSYRLDVSTVSNFATFVGGYENLEVTGGTSQVVTGLSANTIYYARVRAVNATGTGTNSSAGNQTTSQLSAPTTLAASAVTSSGFTANWNAVTGATGYRVDVTTTSSLVATDLIISEYVEGSSNNKYIEIYNGTGSTVNLSDYEVRLFANGSGTADSTQDLSTLSGGPSTLASGGTLVLKNSSAALSLPVGVTAYNSAVANYNGDDALAIWKKSTSAYVDIFGRIGNDPGTSWTSSPLTTVDKTLRRKSSVSGGLTTNPIGTGAGAFTALATEWDQFDVDTASGLGSHSLDSTTTFLSGYQNADAGSSTSLSVTGATASKQYSYVVRATSANSTSSNSDVRTATTKGTSSIAVNSGTTSLTYNGAAQGPTFTVTGSTGVVTYSYEGTGATSYGPTATAPTNVGSYSATATAAADTNFDGVVSSATAFAITKATPTISAAPAASAIIYGQTLASSELTGGTGSAAGTFAFTAPSTAPSAGTASQSVTFTPTNGANYNTASTTVSVVVNTKAITVTADAKSKAYGAADPDLTYQVTTGALVGSDVLAGGLSRAAGENVGTYAISSTLANANYDVTFVPASLTVTAATLVSGDITMTPAGDGSYTASATGGASFTYSYAGRSANGITTSYNSATAPTDAGYYTVTATATGNYSGSNTADYFVAGPVAVDDPTRTKSAGNAAQLIPISELLANDRRITSTGTVETTGLTVTGVTSGSGNTAALASGFIQFTPSSAATDTFTYTVTYEGKTATATVTVTTETEAPAFTLQIVKVGTATFAGGNTTVTHDFIGVPNQTYLVEYTTDLNGTWTSAGNQSTGATGSFSVIITTTGNVAADWNAHMFFRARLAP